MRTPYKSSAIISILCTLSSPLVFATDLIDDLTSKTMVQRVVGSAENNFKYIVFNRSADSDSLLNPDYIYMWHGEKQKPSDFMNLTGLLSSDASTNKPKAVFFALDTTGQWDRSEREFTSLRYISGVYKASTRTRREISMGYDLGSAKAFSYGCKYKMGAVVISQGGVFADESCAPSGMQVLYSINQDGEKYPLNGQGQELSTLANRLDGTESIDRLRSLLRCTNSPIVAPSSTGEMHTYMCGGNNKLTVLMHKKKDHQWNGYQFVSDGFSNQSGASISPPLNNWIKSELSVQ